MHAIVISIATTIGMRIEYAYAKFAYYANFFDCVYSYAFVLAIRNTHTQSPKYAKVCVCVIMHIVLPIRTIKMSV